ncbi:MAG: arylesterase [Bdellovibrionaceae bacterium]|nr:arylesterase [Pseudobdellovibrionaceae bacterium]MDW8189670.1 arylesterase [Pseudobdellovibrionaceae bacterium]
MVGIQKWLKSAIIVFILMNPFFLSSRGQSANSPQELDQSLRIVFIGDSLTEGYGVSREAAYPYLIEQKLKKMLPQVEVVNAGVSGATSQIALAQVRWHIQKKKPDLIVLALGANDGLRGQPLPVLENNLDKAITYVKEQKVSLILIGMRLPFNYSKPYRTDFEKIFRKLAERHQIPLVPFLIQNVALEKELNLEDRIHPNAKGHEKIAEHLWPTVEKIVKSMILKKKQPPSPNQPTLPHKPKMGQKRESTNH